MVYVKIVGSENNNFGKPCKSHSGWWAKKLKVKPCPLHIHIKGIFWIELWLVDHFERVLEILGPLLLPQVNTLLTQLNKSCPFFLHMYSMGGNYLDEK